MKRSDKLIMIYSFRVRAMSLAYLFLGEIGNEKRCFFEKRCVFYYDIIILHKEGRRDEKRFYRENTYT
ncbi:hypothetical protein GCM10007140_04660 [Priestia taiwanensis]|uniref:Uncharacterized protein n=1 Tax=Priestia taiwanensis TaxID=1347902 RepID=A0A917AJ88_9BACI|nr:hypothetical protein GCM10007140_04660 [Priestia taiwanensis]